VRAVCDADQAVSFPAVKAPVNHESGASLRPCLSCSCVWPPDIFLLLFVRA
jgi:hypothetical protein